MIKAILFDWGNTLMIDNHDQIGPMSTWNKIATVKNAKKCLKKISKTIPCYLATNADDSNKNEIYEALKKVGINKYIKDIFSSKYIGYHKPSKEFFKKIINKLEINPNEIVFVGDDIENDIYGSKRAGMIPVHYDPFSISNYDGLKINDLLNLIQIIEDLSK